MLSYILVGLVVPVVIVVWLVRDRAARWRGAEQRWESSCPEEIPPGQFHIVTFDDDVGSILNSSQAFVAAARTHRLLPLALLLLNRVTTGPGLLAAAVLLRRSRSAPA